jgi:superfamily II DNA helicase RecQ
MTLRFVLLRHLTQLAVAA